MTTVDADRLASLSRALTGAFPRRQLGRLVAAAIAIAAAGIASLDPAEAGTWKRRGRRRREIRRRYYKSIKGTFENKTGQPSPTGNYVVTINDKNKRDWTGLSDRSAMPHPSPSSFAGYVDDKGELTDSTVALYVARTTPPIFVRFDNPDLFPLTVSISSGGKINTEVGDPGSWRYEGGTSIVSDKWLLEGGSFTQRVENINVEVSRSDNSGDYMVVSVVLTKA